MSVNLPTKETVQGLCVVVSPPALLFHEFPASVLEFTLRESPKACAGGRPLFSLPEAERESPEQFCLRPPTSLSQMGLFKAGPCRR